MSAHGWQLLYVVWFLALVAIQYRAIKRTRTGRLGFGASLRVPLPSFRLFANDNIDPDYQVVCRAHRGDGVMSEWQSCAPDLSRRFWHALWNPHWPSAASPVTLAGELAMLAQSAKGGSTEMISPFDLTRRVVQLPAECFLSLPYLVLLEMAVRRVRDRDARQVEFAVIRSNGTVSVAPTVILLSGRHAL